VLESTVPRRARATSSRRSWPSRAWSPVAICAWRTAPNASARPYPARARAERSTRGRPDAALCRQGGRVVYRLRQGLDHAYRRHHGRDGQGDGKHLPRRERRAGQRVRADRRARGHRRVGGDPPGEPSPAGERPARSRWGGHCIAVDP
jgi:hypothetical protein